MTNKSKQEYTQTPSKLRTLWETALQLISQYENFDKKLVDLETKIDEVSLKINSTITDNHV
jgi:hypothetical protein